jgi:RNA polymerase sigma-70 factor, ECF subfamily
MHRPGFSNCSPFKESWGDLHDRIILGDRQALEELAEHLLPTLRYMVRRAFSRGSWDLITDAVEDAIVDYGLHPTSFDPSRGVSLDRYLYQASWRNMANLLNRETRRRTREQRYSEFAAVQQAPETFTADSAHGDATRRILEVAVGRAERKALHCWLKGERRTLVLAAALGLGGLSILQQRREVKRFKDRVLKRLGRLALDRHRR